MKEKIFNLIVAVAIAALVLFLVASSYGLFNNFLSQASHAAGGAWKVLGTVLIAASVFICVKLVRGDWQSNFGIVILIIALLALGVSANIGFSYPYNLDI